MNNNGNKQRDRKRKKKILYSIPTGLCRIKMRPAKNTKTLFTHTLAEFYGIQFQMFRSFGPTQHTAFDDFQFFPKINLLFEWPEIVFGIIFCFSSLLRFVLFCCEFQSNWIRFQIQMHTHSHWQIWQITICWEKKIRKKRKIPKSKWVREEQRHGLPIEYDEIDCEVQFSHSLDRSPFRRRRRHTAEGFTQRTATHNDYLFEWMRACTLPPKINSKIKPIKWKKISLSSCLCVYVRVSGSMCVCACGCQCSCACLYSCVCVWCYACVHTIVIWLSLKRMENVRAKRFRCRFLLFPFLSFVQFLVNFFSAFFSSSLILVFSLFVIALRLSFV